MVLSKQSRIKALLTPKRPVHYLLLITAGVLLIWLWLNASSHKTEKNNAVTVQTAAVERRDVPVFLTSPGTVQSPHQVTITPQIDGELKAVYFREGQEVKRGQLLAEIDDRRIRATLDQATAEKHRNQALLKSATLTFKRYQNLLKDDAITAQAVDQQAAEVAQLKAGIAAADANIATAKVQLDYTKINAPISGRAGLRRIDAGNIVRAGDNSALLTLTQLQPIDVVFSISQDNFPLLHNLLTHVKKSATDTSIGTVEARARDASELLDRGHLQTLDNQIDPATGTVQLKARFENTQESLWPGQLVVVKVHVDTLKNALAVPARAVNRGRDGSFIYRVRNGLAEMIPVKVMHEDTEITVIDAPLAINDQIIIDGQWRLKPGAAVTIAQTNNAEKKLAAPAMESN